MTGHTPGPWEVVEHQIGDTSLLAIEARYITVCADVVGNNMEEAEANARLIAAAPELLEALQELLSEVEEGTTKLLAEGKARAAIAHATGEVPS